MLACIICFSASIGFLCILRCVDDRHESEIRSDGRSPCCPDRLHYRRENSRRDQLEAIEGKRHYPDFADVTDMEVRKALLLFALNPPLTWHTLCRTCPSDTLCRQHCRIRCSKWHAHIEVIQEVKTLEVKRSTMYHSMI